MRSACSSTRPSSSPPSSTESAAAASVGLGDVWPLRREPRRSVVRLLRHQSLQRATVHAATSIDRNSDSAAEDPEQEPDSWVCCDRTPPLRRPSRYGVSSIRLSLGLAPDGRLPRRSRTRLVVAATERELVPVEGARSVVCGIGPVEAAVATARALAEERPSAVLHVGIAGARGLEPLQLVLGSEAVYCDAAGPLVPALALPDADLLARLHQAFPEAVLRPIGTSARVGGSHEIDVEAMEGFAVLRGVRARRRAGGRGEGGLERDRRARPGALALRRRLRAARRDAAPAGRCSVRAVTRHATKKPLPPPLPPETRTVGQLVAETLKLYGDHFWPSLALGLSITAINQVTAGHTTLFQVLVLAAAAPLMAASFTGASAIVGGVRPSAADAARAIVVGAIVFVPAAFLTLLYVLPAVAWLALVGLVVPVLVIERPGDRRRASPRGRARACRLRPRGRLARDARDPLRTREADAWLCSSTTSATPASGRRSGSPISSCRRSSSSAARCSTSIRRPEYDRPPPRPDEEEERCRPT